MTSKRPATWGAAQMNETIGVYFGVAMTPWKAIGLLGALMFGARWLVQALATRRAARPTIPRSFWIMSLSGSAMVTAYFIWGKNDAVGVLTNLLPASVAVYNLVVDIKSAPNRANQSASGPTSPQPNIEGSCCTMAPEFTSTLSPGPISPTTTQRLSR